MKRINRVFLIRHGQVMDYDKFPVYGHTDVDLTETGVLQMELMAERLRLVEPTAVYSSDLRRAVIGANLIACHHNVPIHSLNQLREMDFGDWEGLTMEKIRNDYPDELQKRQANIINYKAPGGGESIADFSERVSRAFENLRAEQEGNDIIIVAHGGVNRIILCNALGLDLSKMYNTHQDYGCLNIIDYFPDSTLVRLING